LVDRYVADWHEDLKKVWEVERPFELHLGSVVVIGRADVILDESPESGRPSLTIVDYKTGAPDSFARQQVRTYTVAGRAEGLRVRGAAIHNVSTSSREEVSVRKSEVDNALKDAVRWANEIVAGHFPPRPDAEICASCDYIPLRSVSPDDKFDEGAAGLSSDEEIDAPVRLLRLDFRLAGGGVARAAEVGEKQSVDCKLATVPRLVLLRHLPYFARGFHKFQSANVWHVACSPNAQQN